MRLHHLSVTAFGPFAATETIDFDELNQAGLFLLTGPTGAGKTSVLDAICFALYGLVPGERGVKGLKSQHAAPEARPEVVLDFSIRDRRFRVQRSPEWTRPKLRGTGTKEEPAAALLTELLHGAENFLSSRAQEVGHLLCGLIGMSASQFWQVALLPQGEFQTFLRAGTQQRHEVLQQLFRTDRFSRIETWVQEHGKVLRERSEVEERGVQRLLDAMADRTGGEVPGDLNGTELAAAASDGRCIEWARALVDGSTAMLESTAAEHQLARTATEHLRREHAEAKERSEARSRRAQAEAVLASLAETQESATSAQQRLQLDEHAARCLPMLRILEDSTRLCDRARAARDNCRRMIAQRLGSSADEITTAFLTETERDTRSTLARLETLAPRERSRQDAEAILARSAQRLPVLTGRIAAATVRRKQIPCERDPLAKSLKETTTTAHQRGLLTAALAMVASQLTAARRTPGCRADLELARDLARAATDHAQDARETMQDLYERRLSGMASEIAGRLGAGDPCHVCGSTDHPAPAPPSGDAVTEEAQRRATTSYDEASSDREEAQRKVAALEKQLGVLQQAAAGLDELTATARKADLTEQLARVDTAESEVTRLDRDLSALDAELEETTRTLRTDEQEVAAIRQARETAEQEVAAVTGEIASVFPQGPPDRSLDISHQELAALLADIERALEAFVSYEEAAGRAEEHTARADGAVADAGFTSLEDVRSSSIADEERLSLQRVLGDRAHSEARAVGVLEDLAHVDTEGAGSESQSALRAALDDAVAAEEATARAHHGHESIATSLGRSFARLEACLGDWSPVREEFLRADAMSKLVRGMGGDNHLQVRLSAYVLATRLDQVVAAANERLAQMRDQRYLLERTGRKTRKGSQSGLGLDIRDEWTGDVRDPATLSGGETFVVSLSLALGLADVVTRESGGTEIETLFVDEGFGTLDPETLDDVMDRIDGLRDGGRTVGLVSHVSELRNRIPTQVHVDKRRCGSTLTVRTMIA